MEGEQLETGMSPTVHKKIYMMLKFCQEKCESKYSHKYIYKQPFIHAEKVRLEVNVATVGIVLFKTFLYT